MGILSKGITKYYDIGKTLGKGTFATVKEGCHKKTGSKVAIKIIDKKDAVFDPESLELEVRLNFPVLFVGSCLVSTAVPTLRSLRSTIVFIAASHPALFTSMVFCRDISL